MSGFDWENMYGDDCLDYGEAFDDAVAAAELSYERANGRSYFDGSDIDEDDEYFLLDNNEILCEKENDDEYEDENEEYYDEDAYKKLEEEILKDIYRDCREEIVQEYEINKENEETGNETIACIKYILEENMQNEYFNGWTEEEIKGFKDIMNNPKFAEKVMTEENKTLQGMVDQFFYNVCQYKKERNRRW